MSAWNEIFIQGRIVAEPKIRDRVVTLRVAVNSYRKQKTPRDPRYPQETNFFNVTCFAKTMDVARALVKNDRVEVVGSLEMCEWEAADGQKRTSPEIHADSVVCLSKQGAPSREREAAGPPAGQHPQAPGGDFFDDSDDCPF